MKKSFTIAALVFAAAVASGSAMAQDGVYSVSACTQDGKSISTSMLVSMSHRPKSEVQSILDKTFADVAGRHSAEEFEDGSLLYADHNKASLATDLIAALAQVDHQYGVIAHSPLLPARTASTCKLK